MGTHPHRGMLNGELLERRERLQRRERLGEGEHGHVHEGLLPAVRTSTAAGTCRTAEVFVCGCGSVYSGRCLRPLASRLTRLIVRLLRGGVRDARLRW